MHLLTRVLRVDGLFTGEVAVRAYDRAVAEIAPGSVNVRALGTAVRVPASKPLPVLHRNQEDDQVALSTAQFCSLCCKLAELPVRTR